MQLIFASPILVIRSGAYIDRKSDPKEESISMLYVKMHELLQAMQGQFSLRNGNKIFSSGICCSILSGPFSDRIIFSENPISEHCVPILCFVEARRSDAHSVPVVALALYIAYRKNHYAIAIDQRALYH